MVLCRALLWPVMHGGPWLRAAVSSAGSTVFFCQLAAALPELFGACTIHFMPAFEAHCPPYSLSTHTTQDAFLERHGVKLGFMSAFVKAAGAALQYVPSVNGVIDNNEIIYRCVCAVACCVCVIVCVSMLPTFIAFLVHLPVALAVMCLSPSLCAFPLAPVASSSCLLTPPSGS